MTAAEAAQGEAEAERVEKLPPGAMLIGQRVLEYVRAHPDDPLAPEGLALTVRATHLGASDWNDEASAKVEAAASTA
ncbi:MAG: hypothetical protein WA414_13275, partial [Acidobacteriaceae bacterium]